MDKSKMDQRLRATVEAESASVEKTLQDRFSKASALMKGQEGGLLVKPPSKIVPATNSRSIENAVSPIKPEMFIGSRQVQQIPIEFLLDNPYNARQIYSAEIVRERASSIATQGQLQPALVTSFSAAPGFYYLIDGHYRKKGHQHLGKTEMDCIVHPITNEIDFYRLSFACNQEHTSQSALDNALSWSKLLTDKKVEKEEALVELTGLSWGTINKTLAILKLSKHTLDALEEHPEKFGVAVAYEIYLFEKAAGSEAGVEMTKRVIAEDLSSRDIAKIREALVTKHPRKTKDISRQYKISRGDVQLGFIKDWDSGRVLLDVRVDDSIQRDVLVEELKKRFGVGP